MKRRYLRKYIDILESSAVQPLNKREKHRSLTPEQKLALIKRAIYMNEILPKKKRGEEIRKIH